MVESIYKGAVIGTARSYAKKVITMALKLEENTLYTVPKNTTQTFRKLQPRIAHRAAQNANTKPEKSRL